jgi:hypothetical protein
VIADAPFYIKRVAVNRDDWTAIVPPTKCAGMSITFDDMNSGFAVRGDVADPDSELEVLAGMRFPISGRIVPTFLAGVTCCYVKLKSNLGPATSGKVIVIWTR